MPVGILISAKIDGFYLDESGQAVFGALCIVTQAHKCCPLENQFSYFMEMEEMKIVGLSE